jgi:hypothetical protein
MTFSNDMRERRNRGAINAREERDEMREIRYMLDIDRKDERREAGERERGRERKWGWVAVATDVRNAFIAAVHVHVPQREVDVPLNVAEQSDGM